MKASKDKRTIKIGIIQAGTRQNDIEHNALAAGELIRKVARKGVDIACTSECMLDGYAFDTKEFQENPDKYCLAIEDERVQYFFSLAKELRIHVILGLSLKENPEKGGYYRNSCLLIGPDGTEVGRYHKMHSTFGNLEATFYKHGENAAVFDITIKQETIRIGMMICYDRQMPETARMLAIKGARIIFNPVATGNFKPRWMPHWNKRLMRTRAYENGTFIISVNHGRPRSRGHSLAINPNGRILSALSSRSQARMVSITLRDDINTNNHLKTRRPSTYSPLSE